MGPVNEGRQWRWSGSGMIITRNDTCIRSQINSVSRLWLATPWCRPVVKGNIVSRIVVVSVVVCIYVCVRERERDEFSWYESYWCKFKVYIYVYKCMYTSTSNASTSVYPTRRHACWPQLDEATSVQVDSPPSTPIHTYKGNSLCVVEAALQPLLLQSPSCL